MKKIFLFLLLNLFFISCEKGEDLEPSFYQCNFNFIDNSIANPKNNQYQSLLNDMTKSGVVGINMAIYHKEEGLWLGASGKADLHNNIDMKPCIVSRMGSTIKLYTATLILKLQEEGKLNLDDKIALYLDKNVIDKIENANKATIRQVLQHSSGIYNYIQNPKFQTASLNDLVKEWHPTNLLNYAENESAYFQPEEDLTYSNTNYILLGLLIEKIEKKALYEVFDEKIFFPLGLHSTLFAGKNHVPNGIARGYIDLYGKMQVTESTYYNGWDFYTADGGLISNPYEMSVFFRALMSKKIINANSLNEMLQFKTPKNSDSNFFPIHFGLGIFKIETPQGIAYMHSGDAIGYYAMMLYFPEDGTTIVYAVNSNYGKIDQFVSTKTAIQKILTAIR